MLPRLLVLALRWRTAGGLLSVLAVLSELFWRDARGGLPSLLSALAVRIAWRVEVPVESASSYHRHCTPCALRPPREVVSPEAPPLAVESPPILLAAAIVVLALFELLDVERASRFLVALPSATDLARDAKLSELSVSG